MDSVDFLWAKWQKKHYFHKSKLNTVLSLSRNRGTLYIIEYFSEWFNSAVLKSKTHTVTEFHLTCIQTPTHLQSEVVFEHKIYYFFWSSANTFLLPAFSRENIKNYCKVCSTNESVNFQENLFQKLFHFPTWLD